MAMSMWKLQTPCSDLLPNVISHYILSAVVPSVCHSHGYVEGTTTDWSSDVLRVLRVDWPGFHPCHDVRPRECRVAWAHRVGGAASRQRTRHAPFWQRKEEHGCCSESPPPLGVVETLQREYAETQSLVTFSAIYPIQNGRTGSLGTRSYQELRESLLGAPGLTTGSKDARGSWHRYERSKDARGSWHRY